MGIVSVVLVLLVVFLHAGFLVLEMFFWNKPLGHKIFGLEPEFARKSAPLAANQGLYNGMLATCLLFTLIRGDETREFTLVLLACIVVAGIYAGWTVKNSIFWIQSFPALLALLALLLNR